MIHEDNLTSQIFRQFPLDRMRFRSWSANSTWSTIKILISPQYYFSDRTGIGLFTMAFFVSQFYDIPKHEGKEKFYGRTLEVADRELVEQNSDEILNEADNKDVAFLVVGDPFGATTHTDIILRAKEKNIPYQIVHNASILNAVGCCGLQLYSFGETVSIPFWTDSWKPDSFYDKIIGNRSRYLHTLCLLDIKVKEPTLESLTKKKVIYLPPRFMTVNEAAGQLLEILEEKRKNNLSVPENSYSDATKCIGLARIGSSSQKLIYCTLKEMTEASLGPPLHSLIIPGKLQVLEELYLSQLIEN